MFLEKSTSFKLEMKKVIVMNTIAQHREIWWQVKLSSALNKEHNTAGGNTQDNNNSLIQYHPTIFNTH